jgi:hypothetical protein
MLQTFFINVFARHLRIHQNWRPFLCLQEGIFTPPVKPGNVVPTSKSIVILLVAIIQNPNSQLWSELTK